MEDLIRPWFPQFSEVQAIMLSRILGGIMLPHLFSCILSKTHLKHCHQSVCLTAPALALAWRLPHEALNLVYYLRAFPGKVSESHKREDRVGGTWSWGRR